MTLLSRFRERFRRYPDPSDVTAVSAMTADQWRGIAKRTPTYLEGYRDRPGSQDRAQRRAEWIAALPVFAEARTVFEIGCGCGRNLAALRRRHRKLVIGGCDVSPEAVAEARRILPDGQITQWDITKLGGVTADVVLSVGVLVHQHPALVPGMLGVSLHVAGRALVLVEEDGNGEVAKGPRQWNAEKDTGDYVLWRHPLTDWLHSLGWDGLPTPLPEDLRAPGATKLWIVRK